LSAKDWRDAAHKPQHLAMWGVAAVALAAVV
jgi:hypothetical protein